MKILTIIGARPQFVKAAVVSRAIENHNQSYENKINEIIVHTGQHYDKNMSDVFFDEMKIPKPKYNLGIGGSLHGEMTGNMLIEIEKTIFKENPDVLLIYGDTNSTLAGALAASKVHVPVAHVEAGLRSFNKKMPEEINRILSDHISKWLFCPTDTAVQNLKNEGIQNNKNTYVIQCGDVMYDAALFYKEMKKESVYIKELVNKSDGFYACTIHRAENTDEEERLKTIILALDSISQKTKVILPLHPRTKKKLKDFNVEVKNIEIIDPVGYFDMIYLLDNCKGVFTDSGGLQKEAYFFEKPCITLRDETEWVELIKNKFNILTGADRENIIKYEESFFSVEKDYSMSLYGDGSAGEKIVKALLS
ncbi:MAG: UDP-N-acetylglucosamine 2-epimerase (non-hydrolyzing) [Spirochaetia bacterium]|nr:UDP-N-acetylglucosamine 2-epimerase (non-hydrolyzing) [Spirochaetia bacterium]